MPDGTFPDEVGGADHILTQDALRSETEAPYNRRRAPPVTIVFARPRRGEWTINDPQIYVNESQ